MSEQKDESLSAWGEVPEAAELIETGREHASELQRRRSTSRKRQDFLGASSPNERGQTILGDLFDETPATNKVSGITNVTQESAEEVFTPGKTTG